MVYQLESPDINTVINYCKDLCANDKIEVYDFGGKKDLVLHIYKDEELDLMQHLKMEKMSWTSILKCWKPELI